jgi:pimeloyl-ACP methyl ester carboxylesterase
MHGFGISGTYLEPTAALLAPHYRTFVPDLPGMGRSIADCQRSALRRAASRRCSHRPRCACSQLQQSAAGR